MAKYLLKRIGQTLVIILLVSILTFFLVDLMPGDPVYNLLGEGAEEEAYWQAYYAMNLDKPVIVRYFIWLWDALRGDLGTSYKYMQPVMDVIGSKLGVTVFFAVLSLILSFPIGIFFGVVAAVKRGKWQDSVVTLLANLASVIPQFVVALVLLYVFAMRLNWLPSNGFAWPWENFKKHIMTLIMPLFCLTIHGIGGTCRQTRSSMLEVLHQDYIRTARSKGLKEIVVITRHAVKNGSIPIITMLGNRLAGLIGGSMFVESVFAIPGMGSMMVSAITNKDIPIIQATVLLTSITISVAYILTDILYMAVDPRISIN